MNWSGFIYTYENEDFVRLKSSKNQKFKLYIHLKISGFTIIRTYNEKSIPLKTTVF